MTGSKDWIVVGVSGVTCSGKTTFSQALQEQFPGSSIISQDSYFLPIDDPRHTYIAELNHINWEIPSAIDMERMRQDIREVLSRPPTRINSPLLIIEGFLIFIDKYISSICYQKLFFTLTRDECWARRSVRTYNPADVPGYFDLTVWPEYERHLQLTLLMNHDLIFHPGNKEIKMSVDKFKTILVKEIDRLR